LGFWGGCACRYSLFFEIFSDQRFGVEDFSANLEKSKAPAQAFLADRAWLDTHQVRRVASIQKLRKLDSAFHSNTSPKETGLTAYCPQCLLLNGNLGVAAC
jgi:hypothetical protein